jgi:hypothetical protein
MKRTIEEWHCIEDSGYIPEVVLTELITNAEAHWLEDKNITVQDIIEGKYPGDLASNLKTLVNAWNLRADYELFNLEAF